jgi:hypothetical protein
MNIAKLFEKSQNLLSEEGEKQNSQQDIWNKHDKKNSVVQTHGYAKPILHGVFSYGLAHRALGTGIIRSYQYDCHEKQNAYGYGC